MEGRSAFPSRRRRDDERTEEVVQLIILLLRTEASVAELLDQVLCYITRPDV